MTNQHGMDRAGEPWWRAPVELALDDSTQCVIGPLTIYLQRQRDLWLMAGQQLPESEALQEVHRLPLASFPEDLDVSRFIFSRSPSSLLLRPRLLDRPLVVSTPGSISIPAGNRITFYISSPVSVVVTDGDRLLTEVASVRLSDTWFGPNTREGDLCYAARTRARTRSEDVPERPHRAVTPVTLHNGGHELLTINKLSLPLPYLCVYGAGDGALWTEPVRIEHSDATGLAAVNTGKPPEGMELLGEARSRIARGSLVRAVMNIFTG